MEIKQEKAERLVQIAKMYYEENLTQSEIAKEIGVSRALICRLLNEAKKYGIVTIQIHSPEAVSYTHLQHGHAQQRGFIRNDK